MANPVYGSPPRLWGGTGSQTGYGDLSWLTPPPLGASPFAETMSKFPSLYGGGGYGSPGGTGAGTWGSISFPQPNGPPTGVGGVPGVSGAQLLQTAKFPQINASLNAALGRTNADGTSLVSSVRDPNQAARVDAAGTSYTGSTAGQNATLADFTRNFLAGDPQAKSMTDAQTSAIGKWYGPPGDPSSVQGSLNKLAGQRWQAIQGSLARALGAARGNSNLARLGMGGNSSYANAQFDDAATGILANAAGSQADLNRNNYLAVLQGQAANAGVPQNLLNNYLTRNLTPIQAALQTQSGQLANLGTLGSIRNANTIDRTQQQLTAEQIANINAILGGLNTANISGLQAPYTLPNQGPIPRNAPRGHPIPSDPNYPNGLPIGNDPNQLPPPGYGNPRGYNPQDPSAAGDPAWLYGDFTGLNYGSPNAQSTGTGTGGVGNMIYVPGVGYIPAGTNTGFDYDSPGGQPVVTVDEGVAA